MKKYWIIPFPMTDCCWFYQAVIKGQTDIYIHNLAASTNEQITNDPANDLSPRFINNSSQILFSSDRISDTLSDDSAESKKSADQ